MSGCVKGARVPAHDDLGGGQEGDGLFLCREEGGRERGMGGRMKMCM